MSNTSSSAAAAPKTANSSGAAGEYIAFATSTDEDGRSVNVDVKYIFKRGSRPEDGKLIRRRDMTGPYVLDNDGQVVLDKVTGAPKLNPTTNQKLGDDQFFEDTRSGDQSSESTVMMTNVRQVRFRVIDPPLDPNKDKAVLNTILNPRLLPAAVEMNIQYAPESQGANANATTNAHLEWTKIVFPVYRGL